MKSLAPIVVFTYNRPVHTRKVLDALSRNPEAKQSIIYFFGDGPKENASKKCLENIAQVRKIIERENRFHEKNMIFHEKNKGLAQSIIDGVNEVLQRHDRLIVLEDDIVPEIGFLEYMNSALSIYEEDDRVGCIHAWNYPFELPDLNTETFFLKGADCWGWATWSRAWKYFKQDGEQLLHQINQRELQYSFDRNGTHAFYQMLIEQIKGKVDSWAVRWHASLFLQNMYCLHPKISIVRNIGFDQSGTHTIGASIAQKTTKHLNVHRIEPVEYIPFFSSYRLYQKKQLDRFRNLSFKKKLKNKLKQLFFKKKKNPFEMWSGDYSSWSEVIRKATGYDDDAILSKCKDALLKVKNGEAVYERDSVLFDEIQYSSEVLAAMQGALYHNNGKLSVLDFGGSLGSSYFQHKMLLKECEKLKWNIIEQENFVKAGKEHFESNELRFYYTIEEFLSDSTPNVIFLSSVLQYLEDPYSLLTKLNSLKSEYVIVDRTSIVEGQKDILTLQQVPDTIYKASYPCWFLNENKIIQSLPNYQLISEFQSYCDPDYYFLNSNDIAYWKGYVFKLKTPSTT